MRLLLLLAGSLVLSFPTMALAHLRLIQPKSRYGDQQKTGPCGVAGGTRSENVTVAPSGGTLTVTWEEFIDHPGHFRISFDDDGDDDFVDPASYTDMYTNDAVLLDGIADQNGGTYTQVVQLPDIECQNCTLQVVQVMTDKPPYVPGTNDLYYQCVDLILTRDGAGVDGGPMPTPDGGNPSSDPPGDGGASGGCQVGRGASVPAWLVGFAALWGVALISRRRRRR